MFENVGISISSTSFEVRHLVRQTSVVRVQFSFLSSHVIIAQMAFRFKFRQTMHAIFSKIFFTVSMHGERSSGRLLPYCSAVRRDFLFIRILHRAAALPAATCPNDVRAIRSLPKLVPSSYGCGNVVDVHFSNFIQIVSHYMI